MKKWILILIVFLVIGISADLYWPMKNDFNKINGNKIGHLDAKMWKSYYEKKPIRLFTQLAAVIQSQFNLPWVRSHIIAYHAAKAAFLFQKGTNRTEYDRALPHLTKYFNALNSISDRPFNVNAIAQKELEWWIMRRERDQYDSSAWSQLIQQECAILYGLPEETFKSHADLRVQAMVLRDEKGDTIRADDWSLIDSFCRRSFIDLENVLKSNR